MMRQTITLIFLLFGFSLTVFAQGTQFITGPCSHDSDCASSCCGFKSGKCAGPIIAQTRDGGCGFGDPAPNDRAAVAFRASQGLAAPAPAATTMNTVVGSNPTPAAAGATTPVAAASGARGTQFITGPCQSDSDCADGCCAFKTGKCAGPVVAQEAQDGGCGHGDAEPNANAARLLGYTGPVGLGFAAKF